MGDDEARPVEAEAAPIRRDIERETESATTIQSEKETAENTPNVTQRQDILQMAALETLTRSLAEELKGIQGQLYQT